MSTGFTEEQVREAVDKFLLREIAVGSLRSGARDVKSLRDTVLDLISTALLLRPDSFFYAVYQASNRLRGVAARQLALVDAIIEDAPGTTRPAKKIESTSELTNARAALLDVNAGLNARGTGVRGALGPSVDRFRKSISSFVDAELRKNVVVGGDVISTGDELRAQIRTAWLEAREQHEELVVRASLLTTALSQLNAARLPRTAVQGITSRISSRLAELETVLGSAAGPAESKMALLDLLTMRTLMAKASSFRAPELELAPKTGDAKVLVQIDSDGVEGSVESALSTPYLYDDGATLALSINSGVATPTVNLPRSSRAEIRSGNLAASFPSPAGTAVAIVLDLGSTVVYAPPAYASGATAASDLTANLPGITVTWDGPNNQLVFRSNTTTDISRLIFLTNSAPRAAFVEWSKVQLVGMPNPPSADEVRDAIAASTPLVDVELEETYYGESFLGTRESLPINVLWNKHAQNVNLVINSTNQVSSPTTNFETAGVRVGMALEILSPPASVGEFTIMAVSGGVLTLDDVVSGPPATAAFIIGVDYRGVPDGATVQVVSRTQLENTGTYRVAAGGGGVARLTLTRNIPQPDAALLSAVYTSYLVLRARGTSTTAGIAVTGANPLGFPVSAEHRALLDTLELAEGDFLYRGVRSGDRLLLTSPSALPYTRTISSVEAKRLTVTEPLPYESGSWAYAVQSALVSSYNAMIGPTAVSQFLESSSVQKFEALDEYVDRLIRGARYTGELSSAIQAYRTALSELIADLDAYVVPRESTIDSTIRTMREQGMDRAADMFLSLRIEEFFSMDPEGVSYETWFSHQGARAAREVAPVSKLSRGQGVAQEWRPLSFQMNAFDLRLRSQRER